MKGPARAPHTSGPHLQRVTQFDDCALVADPYWLSATAVLSPVSACGSFPFRRPAICSSLLR